MDDRFRRLRCWSWYWGHYLWGLIDNEVWKRNRYAARLRRVSAAGLGILPGTTLICVLRVLLPTATEFYFEAVADVIAIAAARALQRRRYPGRP